MDRKGLYYSLVLAQTSQEFDSLDNPEYEGTCSKSLCKIVRVDYMVYCSRMANITIIFHFE